MTLDKAFELALQHHRTGRLAEAEAIYRQLLQIDPRHADALHLVGVIADQRGQSELAAATILRAIALRPHAAAYHSNLGEAYRKLDRFDEATAAYREAIRLQPNGAEPYYNLGNVLREQRKFPEAIEAFTKAIELNPRWAAAYTNLGNIVKDEGDPARAVALYRRALEIDPAHLNAQSNLGVGLLTLGYLDEALTSHRTALAMAPNDAEIRCNLGSALASMGRVDEAIEEYRTAIRLDPKLTKPHSNLLLDLHYLSELDASAVFEEHLHWDHAQARPHATKIRTHPNSCEPERPLRIGYVSADFREHSVTYFFERLLECHDREHFHSVCYSSSATSDDFTARLRQISGEWRDVIGLNDDRLADLIRQDKIDILVDLGGHTGQTRLLTFARKPAPIQVTWLGYCDTTGMRTMDYRLTDARVDPPGLNEHWHTEKLVRLPDTAWCYRPHEKAPPVESPPAVRNGYITFGSFNVRPKLTDEVLSLWAKVLQKVPDSRLLLKHNGIRASSVREGLIAFFKNAGIAAERLELVPQFPSPIEHLAAYHRLDIALDSFPYNGTTTTCEALWMGVPVIALEGQTHVSRVGVSLLSTIGFQNLIASSPAAYLDIATSLANDIAGLAEIRLSMRDRMRASPLMDGPRFALHVERAFREMWTTWCGSPQLPSSDGAN